MLKKIRKNASNLIGWSTKRKFVVIESDDWGSIRTRSKTDYNSMLNKNISVDRSNFTKYDCLESNDDLERLFELLSSHKDFRGSSPVFTPMCLVANPNFELIQESNFSDYHFESFTDTCHRYNNHSRVHELWKEGINNKMFVPQFHGREHLNVKRWMNGLKTNDKGLRIMFEHQSIGAQYYGKEPIAEHLAAFDPLKKDDIISYSSILQKGLRLFEELCGYKATYFVASNSPEPKIIERELKDQGIIYLTRYKLQKYPLGNGEFENEINWLGKINKHGQLILTRNCAFEPSDRSRKDWVDACLSDIRNAFFWKKPAIISTHRVNYMSGIVEENGASGLLELDQLLHRITRIWPEVEFITSKELGDIIRASKNAYITTN